MINRTLHFDVFSNEADKGNPVGIVLDADNLNSNRMQRMAKMIGFNETVFILKSDVADIKLKYFTPGHEISLCGHATIGALYCLKKLKKLENKNELTIETNVGVLPISFEEKDGNIFVTMKQDQPKFIEFKGDIEKLANSIGLTKEAIDTDKPVVYGNTGTWTLLVPIKEINSFEKMKPNNDEFPNILTELPKSSVHPFCIDAYDKDCMMHARHFSSPYSGTVEDIATGTGSAVMGAYYLTYIEKNRDKIEFTVEQGTEIDKDGKIYVNVEKTQEKMDVYISGTAVFVNELLF